MWPQGEPGWARPLCASLQHYLDHIFPGLAADTQQEVARAVLARLIYRVEAAISAKKFTALGGLLLDRCATRATCTLPRCLQAELFDGSAALLIQKLNTDCWSCVDLGAG